jgi:hypothetical protein
MKLFPPKPESKGELVAHLIKYGIFPLALGVVVFNVAFSQNPWLPMEALAIIVLIIGIARCGVIFSGGGGAGCVLTLFLAIIVGWFFTLLYIIFGFIYTVVDIIKLFVVKY